jgi:hypothetical protein
MLTQRQVKDRSKTVTRRIGWKSAKAGDLLQGVNKCQGLKPGEKQIKLAVIQLVSVRREPLNAITQAECVAEGFPEMTPADFVHMFCEEMNCEPETIVTRLEFRYV